MFSRNRLYEPVTVGVVVVLLIKLLIAIANLAGAYYYVLSRTTVSDLGDVKVELEKLKSETEQTRKITGITSKRVESLEYTLNFEPSFEWNSALDQRHRAQLNKVIQEGIEARAEEHLKRKITLQTPLKQTTQVEIDPTQSATWELEVKEDIVFGRVVVGQHKNGQIVMPFRLVIAKSLEARPITRPWWKVWGQ